MYQITRNIVTQEYSIVEYSGHTNRTDEIICSIPLAFADCQGLLALYNAIMSKNIENTNRLNVLYKL